MAEAVNPVRMVALETSLDDLRQDFKDPAITGRPLAVYMPNRLILGSPAAAPNAATASGSVTESDRLWAANFESSEGDFQTKLSAVVTATLSAAQAILTGARSTDVRIDLVNIWTRPGTGNDLDWRRAGQVANPAAGTWTFTDNSAYTSYLGNPPPCRFAYPLMPNVPEGENRLQRVILRASRALAASSSAYWILWIELRKRGATLPYLTLGKQDTTQVGFQPETPYFIPMFHLRGEIPKALLDTPLGQDDAVYFMSRGVGAVSPLPNLSAMVEVTREAP